MDIPNVILKAIFDQAAVGIAQIGLDGTWMFANNRYHQMLGYSEAELRTKTLQEITHPEDYAGSLAGRRQLLEGLISSHSMEKRFIRNDGTVFWGRLHRSLVRDQENLPRFFIAIVEDISDKIQAQLDLKANDERFRLALKAGLGMWMLDFHDATAVHAPQYEGAFGRSPNTAAEWLSLIHPDDRERVRATARQSLQEKRDWETEFRLLLSDGSTRWLLSKGATLRNDDGKPRRMIGVSFDITERKRAEAALRESEERFRGLADTAPVMIWVSGVDKLCTFFNKPWLDFTGRSMEQELGNGWASEVHPEDLERCLATYSSSFDGHRSFQMEYRLRRADGEYRWVLDHGTPRYRDGEFAGFVGSCIDVTEQKLLAEQLRSQTVQLIEAQRLAKIGSWEKNFHTGETHRSDQIFQILGLPNDAPASHPAFVDCVHPKDREKFLEAERNVRSSRAPVETEFRILRSDGEVRFVRAIAEAIRDDRGAVVRTVGAIQDITGYVEARELLRESEQRLKNAERLAHVGHWQWDIRTNHVSGSDEMYRIFGKPQNYVPSYEGFLEDLIPQDRKRVELLISDSLARKTGHSIEYQIAHPDSGLRTISCIWEVLTDEEGLPARLFGTCQDITDSRRAQEASFARQKLESVGTLANGIAHDFNNLMGGVLAQAELALAELAAGSYPEEELKGIRNVAINGAEIVRQLMIYAGKEPESLGPVDVSRVVEGMLPLLKVSVSKHAVLETDLAQDLPAVWGSAGQLRQIVMNLVLNASEAIGDQDGVIRVAIRCVTMSRGFSEAAVRAEGDYLQLEISDTGRGIPPEVQARLFDPYFTTKSAGRGLGLAVVDGIVRGLGGEVRLVSEPGKGATFQILLPCAERTAEAIPDPISLGMNVPHPLPVATVLVVEDEDPLRQAVAKMLRKRGFEVLEAANGSAAIDVLRGGGTKIDLILLDMTIPGSSSSAVVAECAQRRPDSKVILTSAHSEGMAMSTMNWPQIRGFIRKPFHLADLVQKLLNVLSA